MEVIQRGWYFYDKDHKNKMHVTPIYKNGRKEDPGNYRPDLGAGEDYGAVHIECTHRACEGQPGDPVQPAWVHERQVLLDQPDLLL